jgi:hypothetical protein
MIIIPIIFLLILIKRNPESEAGIFLQNIGSISSLNIVIFSVKCHVQGCYNYVCVECLFLAVNGIQRVSIDKSLVTGDEQNSILITCSVKPCPPLTDKTETTVHTYPTKHKYFLHVLVLFPVHILWTMAVK